MSPQVKHATKRSRGNPPCKLRLFVRPHGLASLNIVEATLTWSDDAEAALISINNDRKAFLVQSDEPFLTSATLISRSGQRIRSQEVGAAARMDDNEPNPPRGRPKAKMAPRRKERLLGVKRTPENGGIQGGMRGLRETRLYRCVEAGAAGRLKTTLSEIGHFRSETHSNLHRLASSVVLTYTTLLDFRNI